MKLYFFNTLLFIIATGFNAKAQYFDQIFEDEPVSSTSNEEYNINIELDSIKDNGEYKIIRHKRDSNGTELEIVFYKVYEESIDPNTIIDTKSGNIVQESQEEPSELEYPTTHSNYPNIIYIKSDKYTKPHNRKLIKYKKPKNYSNSTRVGVNYNTRTSQSTNKNYSNRRTYKRETYTNYRKANTSSYKRSSNTRNSNSRTSGTKSKSRNSNSRR